jgi:hypothetical protein
MYFEIWAFSVQNAPRVIKYGEKPLIIERGPYAFMYVWLYYTRIPDIYISARSKINPGSSSPMAILG